MRDQQQCCAASQSYCLPSFFAVHETILQRKKQRIIKNKLRGLKADTVLIFIQSVLVFVPGDLQRISKNVTTSVYRKMER